MITLPLSRRTLLPLGVGVLVVIVLGGLGWFWHATLQSRALEAYAAALGRLRLSEAPQAKPEERAAALREVEALLARYPSSSAAPQAAYKVAGLKYDAGDYAGARSAYEVALAGGASGTLRTLARAGIGYSWEAERAYPKALEAYRVAMGGLDPKDFYYETLLADLARAQELTGKNAEAVETYRRLLQEFPQSRRAETVRARLMVLGAG